MQSKLVEFATHVASVEFNDEKEFDSLKLAEAFQEGVEYANDSALEVVAIEERDGKFVVLLKDKDKE